MSFRLQNVCLGNVTGIEVGMMFMRLYRLNRCRLQLFCLSMCSSCLRQGSNNFSSIAIAKQHSKTHWGHKYRPCGLTWRTEEYQRACLVPTLFWALGNIFFLQLQNPQCLDQRKWWDKKHSFTEKEEKIFNISKGL